MQNNQEFLRFRKQAATFVAILSAIVIYANGCLGQEWNYTPFETTKPYNSKCRITKIGNAYYAKNGDIVVSDWGFDASNFSNSMNDDVIKINGYPTTDRLENKICGYTVRELMHIKDSADLIQYFDVSNAVYYTSGKSIDIGYGEPKFEIETWYDTVKPKKQKYAKITGIQGSMNKGVGTFTYTPDTLKPKLLYGIAGVIQEKPSDTLKRYYFHKYIFYMDRMKETNGRTSARFQDSVERYYKLLYPKK